MDEGRDGRQVWGGRPGGMGVSIPTGEGKTSSSPPVFSRAKGDARGGAELVDVERVWGGEGPEDFAMHRVGGQREGEDGGGRVGVVEHQVLRDLYRERLHRNACRRQISVNC